MMGWIIALVMLGLIIGAYVLGWKDRGLCEREQDLERRLDRCISRLRRPKP